MVEPHRAQQYMMVSFYLDRSEIGFPHYIRIGAMHKILGLGEPNSGYMYLTLYGKLPDSRYVDGIPSQAKLQIS